MFYSIDEITLASKIHLYKKLLEIEKEIVREVTLGVINTSWANLQIAKHKSLFKHLQSTSFLNVSAHAWPLSIEKKKRQRPSMGRNVLKGSAL